MAEKKKKCHFLQPTKRDISFEKKGKKTVPREKKIGGKSAEASKEPRERTGFISQKPGFSSKNYGGWGGRKAR